MNGANILQLWWKHTITLFIHLHLMNDPLYTSIERPQLDLNSIHEKAYANSKAVLYMEGDQVRVRNNQPNRSNEPIWPWVATIVDSKDGRSYRLMWGETCPPNETPRSLSERRFDVKHH